MNDITKAKTIIHELYNSLAKRPSPSSALLDITDVLLQVYKKIENQKHPEILVNQLVNYIYIVGLDNHLSFKGNDEALVMLLGDISKKAGINSKYRAAYADKFQFYSCNEHVPIR